MAQQQPQTPDQKSNATDAIKAIRTFESDAAEILRHGNQEVAKIVAAQESRPKELIPQSVLPPNPEKAEKNKTMLIISGIFFVAGIVVLSAYLLLKPAEPPAPPRTSTGQAIITVDSQKIIDISGLTKKKIIDAIVRERDGTTLKLNATQILTVTEKTPEGTVQELSAADLLLKLSSSAPSQLLRSLEQTYALGLIGFDGNQPFLIVRTNSFESAYNGMLNFETDFYRDAGSIFVRGELLGLATSTLVYSAADPKRRLFHDLVASNLDTRVVKDKNGMVVFLYAFPNQSTLVFTTNTKTFTEIVEKLRRATLSR